VTAATLLALGAAFLHAAWNLLVKTSDDRFLAAWGQFLVGGLVFVPLLFVVGPPGLEVAPLLVCSSVVNVVYVAALVRAYGSGDFSLAYPLARGGGALVAAVGGVWILGDDLGPGAWIAILVVVAGLVSLVRPGVATAVIGWSALTAAAIGTYTVIDIAGARRSSAFGYGIVVMIGAGTAVSVAGILIGRAPDFVRSFRTEWWRYVVGGACTTLAYSMVLAAGRLAPVGYVAALREFSVVLGALAGWLLLRERLGRPRVYASVVVAAGLALLVVLR
jgi:drug/metabolite transporter (DMT)-like permease